MNWALDSQGCIGGFRTRASDPTVPGNANAGDYSQNQQEWQIEKREAGEEWRPSRDAPQGFVSYLLRRYDERCQQKWAAVFWFE